MKPIEPGCKAILINLKNNTHLNGESVIVVSYCEEAKILLNEDHWRVKGSFQGVDETGAAVKNIGNVHQRNLLRIDDPDFPEEDKNIYPKVKEKDKENDFVI